jgi:hypothetical protein
VVGDEDYPERAGGAHGELTPSVSRQRVTPTGDTVEVG